MTSSLDSFRCGAVGFIVWLDVGQLLPDFIECADPMPHKSGIIGEIHPRAISIISPDFEPSLRGYGGAKAYYRSLAQKRGDLSGSPRISDERARESLPPQAVTYA